jgi:hypothetical protein
MQGLLFWGGLAIAVMAGIRLIVLAFSVNLYWGLACLFIPGVLLLFGFLYWHDHKKPFLYFLAGLGAMLASTKV